MLARYIDEHWDWEEIARGWFEAHGLLPAQLWSMTPEELVAVLGDRQEEEKGELTPIEDLHAINHVKRAGMPPVVPGWLMRKVPRR
jgi:hypothetical protein